MSTIDAYGKETVTCHSPYPVKNGDASLFMLEKYYLQHISISNITYGAVKFFNNLDLDIILLCPINI